MISKNEQIAFDSLIEQINNEFGDIAEIYVAHLPSASEVDQLSITVHTGKAESFEQYVEIASVEEATIDVGEAEPLCVPFEVVATLDGPGHVQGAEGTTVYMSESVLGAESRELDAGLSILRQKVAGVCPSCGDDVESFGNHYRDSRTCREAERV
jgi:hypothetical protein